MNDLRWYHLDGTECVAGWYAEGPNLGRCARGGGPVTPCPPVDGVPLSQWTPEDVARNIVNQLFDEAHIPVVTRQAINDRCDRFVSGLLGRWLLARLPDPDVRWQAVRNVDSRYGYTYEFAANPAAHLQEYDEEEVRLVCGQPPSDTSVNPDQSGSSAADHLQGGTDE